MPLVDFAAAVKEEQALGISRGSIGLGHDQHLTLAIAVLILFPGSYCGSLELLHPENSITDGYS